MKFSWFYRILDYLTHKQHIFVVKSTDGDNTTEIVNMVSTTVNSEVDIYSNCEDLFFNLGKHKNYYQVGVIHKSDKKNTANILKNLVTSEHPRIKIVTYSDKKTFKSELVMS